MEYGNFVGKHPKDENDEFTPSPETKAFMKTAGKDIQILKATIFGNDDIGEKGMKKKVDEMHEIITQVKGWKTLGIIIIMVGSVIAIFKVWLK